MIISMEYNAISIKSVVLGMTPIPPQTEIFQILDLVRSVLRTTYTLDVQLVLWEIKHLEQTIDRSPRTVHQV